MDTDTKTDNRTEGALAWASENAPTYCEAVETLYSWASNYEDYAPFRKFLDLIGYADTAYGDDSIVFGDWKRPASSLGYVELGYLADALSEYANRPLDVDKWVMELLEIESEHGR
jgi:hypothetical protein